MPLPRLLFIVLIGVLFGRLKLLLDALLALAGAAPAAFLLAHYDVVMLGMLVVLETSPRLGARR